MASYEMFDGVAGETWQQTSSNTAQTLTAANLLGSGDSEKCKGLFLHVTVQSVLVAFGGKVAAQTTVGHLLTAGDTLYIRSWGTASEMQFISAASGSHGTLTLTAEF